MWRECAIDFQYDTCVLYILLIIHLTKFAFFNWCCEVQHSVQLELSAMIITIYLFFLWIFTCSYLKVIYMERWLKQQLCQFVGFKLEGKSSEMICHHVGSPSLGHVRIFYFKQNIYFCLLLPPSKIRTNLRNMVKVWCLLYHTLSWCSCPQTGRNPWISVSFRKSQTVWFDCLLMRQGQERFWLTKLWCQAKLSLHNWRMLLWYLKGDVLDTTESANKNFTY